MTRRFLWALTALFTLAISRFSLRACRGGALLADHPADDLGIHLGDDLVLVQPAGAAARLELQVVAHAGLLLHDLAAAGDLEALLGAGVGLLLGHYFSSFVAWAGELSSD